MMKSRRNIFSGSILLVVLLISLMAISCKKKKVDALVAETGTVTDVDGNTYKTMKMGGKWWMTENLKVKTYRNGVSIKEILATDPDTTWANIKKGAWCVYDNNTQGEFNKYGVLYNWYAVSDTNNIAPAGWHVPSDDEWKDLEIYVGMNPSLVNNVNWRGTNQGDALKAHSPLDWTRYGDVWSTNSSGFSALGGSCRVFNGVWGDPGTGKIGFWWANSQHVGNNEAWYRYLDYKKSSVFRYYGPKSYGMSIRCVRD